MQPARGFRFKQFTIHDDHCQMKVGTDGVLLGAWVEVKDASNILDIGTGSGLISLMLAQRTPSTTLIDAVEAAEADAGQARLNVSASPWHDRVNVYQCTIQDFHPSRKYDLIVSNPPFFSSSLLPPSGHRAQARHTVGLTHSQLLESVSRMLATDGRFAAILPATEGDLFRQTAQNFNLNVMRSLAFYTRPGKKQERWLFELTGTPKDVHEESMILYGQGAEWSTAYRNLTGNFYLTGEAG